MIQQKQEQAYDQGSRQQGKVRALTESQLRTPIEHIYKQFPKQAIYRISSDGYELKYQHSDSSYRVHSQLLNHTRIRPTDREKLKSWMLSETHNMYQRETYAYASRYLDMFFSKGYKVQKNAFQALGIACLILAAKVNQRRLPSISFQIFDKNQIFGFQKGILQIFRYKVFPVTYITLSQLLFHFWDSYDCQRHPFKQVKYLKQGVQSIKRVRSICETLDCMDLVYQTLDFPIDKLVWSVFNLENRRICLIYYKNKQKIWPNQSNQLNSFCAIYDKFMADFLRSVKSTITAFSNLQIDEKLNFYVMQFSRIKPKIYANPNYKNFMFEINKQTYHSSISELAQKCLSRKITD